MLVEGLQSLGPTRQERPSRPNIGGGDRRHTEELGLVAGVECRPRVHAPLRAIPLFDNLSGIRQAGIDVPDGPSLSG
jgi:hypothetical protein